MDKDNLFIEFLIKRNIKTVLMLLIVELHIFLIVLTY